MFDNDMLNLKTYLILNDNLSNLNAFNKNVCKNIKKKPKKKNITIVLIFESIFIEFK